MQSKPGLRGVTIWPRRNGKDLIAINIFTAKAMQRVGKYLYLGPYQNQTRDIVWNGNDDNGRPFLDYIPPELIVGKRSSLMEVDLINGSMLKLGGSDKFDRLVGKNYVGLLATEYSLQRPEAWQLIQPMLAANGGWALFNYTMRGMNHGYKMMRMAEKNKRWFFQFLTCEDTGYPTLEAIQREREDGMPESKIQQEFYNDWNASSEETFIPLDFVAPCLEKEAELQPKDYENSPRIFGVDVAYAAKGDKAVIAYRQGRKLHWVRWFRGMDNPAFADEILRLQKLFKPHAICIDAGRGEGVYGILNRKGLDHIVHPIHFGGKVYAEGIANMKAKLWLAMEAWFMNPNKPDLSNLDPETNPFANEVVAEELAEEISTPRKVLNDKNEIAVEGKASLKARGEDSPDLAEALSLAHGADDIEPDDILTTRQAELGMTIDDVHLIEEQENKYDPMSHSDSWFDGDEEW